MSLDQIDWRVVLAVVFAIEQVLASTDQVKSNSTLQLVCNVVGAVVGQFKGTANPNASAGAVPGKEQAK